MFTFIMIFESKIFVFINDQIDFIFQNAKILL